MDTSFARLAVPENLHGRVTRALGLHLIKAEAAGEPVSFPNEAGLCEQLGVSRSILREAVKVLADKGMLEVRPRSGTRSRPRVDWNLLDPDILCWQAEAKPDGRFLRELCEVRLAIEPTASGFAAVRATAEETEAIAECLERRETLDGSTPAEIVESNLRFYEAVVAASHNPMFRQLNASAFQGPLYNSDGLESGNDYLRGCLSSVFDLSIARTIRFGKGRNVQVRVDMFNAPNAVGITGRMTTMNLASPNDPVTITNLPFASDGTLIASRSLPRGAGFGVATNYQAARTVQGQVRFSF